MTIAASSIIAKVRQQLIDTGAAPRWTDAELLSHMSDGQRIIVAIAPTATSRSYILPLLAGTRQPMAENVHTLLSILHNCDVLGVSPGRAVRVVLREQLDSADPNWHQAPSAAEVRNYIYDPMDVAFYVYPPNDGSGHVRAIYSQIPQPLLLTTDALTVADIYQTPLFDYVMFRCHAKDGDFPAGQGLAQSYLATFMSAMGVTSDELLKVSPNMQLGPTNLAIEGAAK